MGPCFDYSLTPIPEILIFLHADSPPLPSPHPELLCLLAHRSPPPPPPPPRDEVNTWEAKFGFLQEGLALLNQIQRKWVYLEPIFARGALPQQQTRFRNVDEEFRRVMTQLDVRGRGGREGGGAHSSGL